MNHQESPQTSFTVLLLPTPKHQHAPQGKREGEGQTTWQAVEMVSIPCVRSSVPFPITSAFPHTGPSSHGAKQAKQSKADKAQL